MDTPRRGGLRKQSLTSDPASVNSASSLRAVLAAVLLTSLLWLGVVAALLVTRTPQPEAFAFQPPPATWTPSPSPTAVPAPPTATPAARRIEPTATEASRSGSVTTSSTAPLNINQADVSELEQLPAIGPVTAQAIVDYRSAHGPFQSIEELDQVKGIGAATLDTLRPFITVE